MTSLRSTATPLVEPFVELPPGPRDSPQSRMVNVTALFWRQRRWLARVTAIGGALTLLISLLIPNRYESSTELMPPDMHGGASEALMAGLLGRAGAGGLVGLGANLLGIDSSGAIFIGVLHSRSVADNLVKRFDLKRVYRSRRDQDARRELANRTTISEDRKSGIIAISVEDRDPNRAAALASAYVDELNHLLADLNTSSAHRERVFIEERLKVVKAALDDASKQLSDFSAKNVTLDPKEQGKAMVGAAVTLQGELIAAETQLRGLEPIYSDGNVRIQSLRARIAELRHQLAELRGSDPNQATPSVSGDGASYPSFRQLPTLGLTYADLYREVKIREVVFETLTQQYEMAKIAEAKEIPSVKVLDPANVPEKKSGPHRAILTALGLMVSFALGALFLIAKAGWTQVGPDDPRKALANEVLRDTRPLRLLLANTMMKVRRKFPKNAAPLSHPASNSDFEIGGTQ
jgi:capsule polysaccharide export protein KpsE/RkpR